MQIPFLAHRMCKTENRANFNWWVVAKETLMNPISYHIILYLKVVQLQDEFQYIHFQSDKCIYTLLQAENMPQIYLLGQCVGVTKCQDL